MGQNIIEGIVGIATTVVVLAIVAVLVSKNSQTGTVLTSGGTALSGLIKAAVSPVTASSTTELGQVGTF